MRSSTSLSSITIIVMLTAGCGATVLDPEAAAEAEALSLATNEEALPLATDALPVGARRELTPTRLRPKPKGSFERPVPDCSHIVCPNCWEIEDPELFDICAAWCNARVEACENPPAVRY